MGGKFSTTRKAVGHSVPSARTKNGFKKPSPAQQSEGLAQDSDLAALARNVARLLIESGIDVATLQDILQIAYVGAASGASRFRNKKPNQSGIAAMTGLSRAEVKRLLDPELIPFGATARSQPKGVERVVKGWITDKEFTQADGTPSELPRGKGPGTFDSLVARYGADIPAAAVLRELVRRKRVKVNLGTVVVRETGIAPQYPLRLRRLLNSVNPILESLADDGSHSVSLDTQAITIELPDDLSYSLLQAHLATAVPIFFEQARIAANGAIRSRRRRGKTSKGPSVRFELIALTKK